MWGEPRLEPDAQKTPQAEADWVAWAMEQDTKGGLGVLDKKSWLYGTYMFEP